MRAFQKGLNARLDHIPDGADLKLKVDGDFGPATLKAWRTVRWFLGLPADHPPTKRAQVNVRRPWTRTPRAVRRSYDRRRQAAQGGARKRAVKWALEQVGTVEQPPGSNSGPKISGWILAGGGTPGWAWCQYFANAVAVHGGCAQLPTGYTVFVMQGRYRDLGFVPIPVSQAQPGDMLFYKFPGVSSDPCDHVGIKVDADTSVEGNTSSGNAGSQNNGGGVYTRVRPRALIVGAVRVPYKD